MSSLVSVLAKELDVWPDDQEYFTCDPGGEIRASLNTKYDFHPKESVNESEWTAEYAGIGDDFPRVTKQMWQAERDRQKGGEWKRHRGGKCPVKAGTKVSTRHRDGEVVDVHFQTAEYGTHKAVMDCVWKHNGDSFDIMQYKVISQPQAEELEVIADKKWYEPAEAPDTREFKGPFPCAPAGDPVTELEWDIQFQQGSFHLEAKTEQMETPFKWRDEVTELNAYIEKFTRERDELIERLASEGFALIPPVVSVVSEFAGVCLPIEEWQIGDIVEVVSVSDESSAPLGVFKITDIDATEPKYELAHVYFPNHDQMKFVRRP